MSQKKIQMDVSNFFTKPKGTHVFQVTSEKSLPRRLLYDLL